MRDAQIFTFAGSRGGRFGGGKALFFSRRIGREPRGIRALGGQTSATTPNLTSILGAAKLTGRTTGGLSVGALAAVTGQESRARRTSRRSDYADAGSWPSRRPSMPW